MKRYGMLCILLLVMVCGLATPAMAYVSTVKTTPVWDGPNAEIYGKTIYKDHNWNSPWKEYIYFEIKDGGNIYSAIWDIYYFLHEHEGYFHKNDFKMTQSYWSPGSIVTRRNYGYLRTSRDDIKYASKNNIILNPADVPNRDDISPFYDIWGEIHTDEELTYVKFTEADFLDGNEDVVARSIMRYWTMRNLQFGRSLHAYDMAELLEVLFNFEGGNEIIISSKNSDWNKYAYGNYNHPIWWESGYVLGCTGTAITFIPYDPDDYKYPLSCRKPVEMMYVYSDSYDLGFERTKILAQVEAAAHEFEANRISNGEMDLPRFYRVYEANIDVSKDADWAFVEAGLDYLNFMKAVDGLRKTYD